MQYFVTYDITGLLLYLKNSQGMQQLFVAAAGSRPLFLNANCI
ncbi:hypothetical protein [Pelosinus baikalensis]|nr:hypothetical protein [Pelosinus baikalensis]